MKIYLSILLILVCSFGAVGQIKTDLPDPKEIYSKHPARLIKISNLLGVINNDKQVFRGKITNIKWQDQYDIVYFEIGRVGFELEYSNVSNAGRSHLKDLIKRHNRIAVNADAGGSNGIWMVREIRQK